MVSSRATEYIFRFSRGYGEELALEKLIEYRENCKRMYAEADAWPSGMKFKNYPAQRYYLEDMLERIQFLAEARDHLRATVNKNKAKSAMPFIESTKASEKKAKTPEYFFARKVSQFEGYNEHEVKYILRFQELGIDGSKYGCAILCARAADAYQDALMAANSRGEIDCDYMVRVKALNTVVEYFESIQKDIKKMDPDSGKAYELETDDSESHHWINEPQWDS
jgi:hypothetical protein